VIYNTYKNFLFVHIPRTGGISISDALLDAFPDSIADVDENRHRYAMGCRGVDRLGKIWDRLYKFTVIRNPWEIIESDFHLMSRDVRALHVHTKMKSNDRWYRKLKRVAKYKSFSEFVVREYLGRNIVWEGGFWRTWCCDADGGDLGITVLRYEDLAEEWLEVQKKLGFRQPLDQMNSANELFFGPKYVDKSLRQLGIEPVARPTIRIEPLFPCEWTPAIRDAVGEMCHMDLSQFGYEFNKQLVS
jgi:hypothetical protein